MHFALTKYMIDLHLRFKLVFEHCAHYKLCMYVSLDSIHAHT